MYNIWKHMVKNVKTFSEWLPAVTASENPQDELVYDPDAGTLILLSGTKSSNAVDCSLDPGAIPLRQDEAPSSPGLEKRSSDCRPEETVTEQPYKSEEDKEKSAEADRCEISEDVPFIATQRTDGPPRKKPQISAPPCWISFFILCLIALGYYLFEIDCYRAEFHILYPPGISEAAESTAWPLEKELRVFESPVIAYLVAQDLLHGGASKSAVGPDGNIAVSFPSTGNQGAFSGQTQQFSNSGKLAKWLTSNMEIHPAPAKGMITVSIAGSDPDFLTAVLDSYIRQYHGYVKRAALEQKPSGDALNAPEQSDMSKGEHAGYRMLSAVELQVRECASALDELGAGKGMFRGFLSEDHLNAVPSLKTIQAKIVDLEIEKIALLDHFSAESREVREKDLQIKKLRNAMQECLSQHLSSLKRKVAALALEKAQIERKVLHEQPGKPATGIFCSDNSAQEPAALQKPAFSGTLKPPFISRQPFIVSMIEYLTECLGKSSIKGVRVLETKKDQDSGLSSYAKPAGSGLEVK